MRFVSLIKLIILFGFVFSLSAQANTKPLDSPKYCGSCHQRIYKEWSSSRMGMDLQNDHVYQFYTGTNPQGKMDGLGYKPFTHGKKGDCADCHVPELVIEKHAKGEEVDLGVAMKKKQDHGISCHFCHSIAAVHVKKDKNGRYNTRIFNSVTLDKTGAIHGPIKDAAKTEHPNKYSQLYKQSEICGTCHLNQEKFLSISQYDDWKQAYDSGKTDKTCQQCHMPLIKEAVSISIAGKKRHGMRAHTFIGSYDAGMLKKALALKVKPIISKNKLIVYTTVENVGAGHKVPGSGPIRNVILKIDVTDEQGNPLTYIGSKKGLLPPLAGFGNPKTKKRDENDWAGMPGKMYAKVYRSKPIPKMGNKPMVGVGGFAAEAVVFDTALKPFEPDYQKFSYQLPENAGKLTVKARLVYRDAFKPLSDRKHWKLAQREMKTVITHIQP